MFNDFYTINKSLVNVSSIFIVLVNRYAYCIEISSISHSWANIVSYKHLAEHLPRISA